MSTLAFFDSGVAACLWYDPARFLLDSIGSHQITHWRSIFLGWASVCDPTIGLCYPARNDIVMHNRIPSTPGGGNIFFSVRVGGPGNS